MSTQPTSRRRAPSQSHQESLEKLWLVADEMLQQIVSMVTDLTDSQLQFESTLIPGSTALETPKPAHTHDHYRLLLEACENQSDQDRIHLSYDVRSRNIRSETSQQAALDSFVALRKRLATVTQKGKAVPADKRVDLNAVTPFAVEVESSFSRELWFCILHATHHLALLRVIIVGELGLSLPATFGTAPSTLVHRSWDKQHRSTRDRASAKL
ncbi:hypothetical protein OIV83_002327 [Microbotryomycetes sp. JL201]|nr:hypothetical protein OIV83_002327 [Microbotryomycetes sp. JL201]